MMIRVYYMMSYKHVNLSRFIVNKIICAGHRIDLF